MPIFGVHAFVPASERGVDVEVATMQQSVDGAMVFEFGPFSLIASERLLLNKGEPVALGGRAFDILIALLERAGEVVSHRDLVKRAWPDVIVEETSLRFHVAALRRGLGDGRDGARYVTNISGRGYCFVAPVQRWLQPVAAAAKHSQYSVLPAPLGRMVGRNEAVDALRSEITSRRFVSIVGPGGVGKTTVAIAAAHAMAPDFCGAVCFVDLSSVRDGAQVISAVASAMGCLEQSQDSLPRLLALLSEQHMLLVLDSCELVIESVAALAEQLFREAPRVHVLATTREALRVEGEHIHLLQPLDSPSESTAQTVASVLQYSAVQLFIDRAIADGYQHHLSDADAEIVAGICRQLDGMPLAIEVAASRTSTYGISGLAQLIGDRLMLLWQGRRSVPRHQTLEAMLDWSYDLLSESEKAVLSALSVFNGAFTLETAEAALFPPCLGPHASNVIIGLIEKSLISVSRTEAKCQYRLLDTTRAYAAAKLQQRGDANEIARRHAQYYAERLAGIQTNVFRNCDLTSYSRDIGDIRAALEWSFSEAGERAVAVPLGAGAALLFLALSMLSECRCCCLQTMQALSGEDRGTWLELGLQLTLATSSHHLYGDSAEVVTALEYGLSLADRLADAEWQMEFLAGLNLYRHRLADFGGSVTVAERYAAIARQLGGTRETVMAEWMLGASHHLAGNQAKAQQSYQSAFKLAALAGFSEVHSFGHDHHVMALFGYARTLWLAGLPNQAIQVAQQGIEVVRRQKHPVSLCIGLTHAAPVFLWRRDLQIAEELIEQLISHARKYSLTNYHIGGLGLRGRLLLSRGETQLGVQILREALAAMQNARRYILSTAFSCALAEGLARTGCSAEATLLIEGVVEDALRGSGTFELPELLRVRGEVLLASSRENWPAAEASLISSLTSARQQSALGWELRSALILSRWWKDRGRTKEARTLLTDVYGRFTEGFDTADLREAARELGELESRRYGC
jgi:predicted ATPase/DNA-binding winged helix-turn-helix (wHTH) protein